MPWALRSVMPRLAGMSRVATCCCQDRGPAELLRSIRPQDIPRSRQAPRRDPAQAHRHSLLQPRRAGRTWLGVPAGAAEGFGTRVIDRFDIVSWDPRGMGGLSSPAV